MTSSPPPASASSPVKEAPPNQPSSTASSTHQFLQQLQSSTKLTTTQQELNWYHSHAAAKDQLDLSKLSNEIIQASLSLLQKQINHESITGTIRLATLFIYYGNANTNANSNGNGNGNNSAGNGYSQQAGKVLHQLTQRILTKLQNQDSINTNDVNDDASISIISNARWYLQLLLNVMEPIAGLNTVCATIWRGIGDLAIAISQAPALQVSALNQGGDIPSLDYHDRDQDYQCCVQAMERIYVLIREGFHAAVDLGVEEGQQQRQRQQAAKMGKLLKFFFMRLMQLIPLISSHKHYMFGKDGDKGTDTDSSSLDNHLFAMIQFRGFVIQNRDGLGTDSAKQLSQKINACLEKLLGVRNNVHAHNTTWTLIPYHPSTLNSLLQLCRRGSASASASDFWVGKLDTLVNILNNIHSTLIEKHKTGKVMELSSEEWDVISSICENLIFHIVPMCYEFMTCMLAINIEFGIIFANVLSAIGDILILLENTSITDRGGKDSRRMLYRWMIRCLASIHPNARGKERKGGTIHPLASQMWMAVVQTHIVRSFFRDRGNNGNASSDDLSVCSKSDDLVRIMSRIMFDRRTGATLRRNIGVILYRLLTISNPKLILLRKRIEAILISAYLEFLSNMKDKQSSLKRKRNSSGCSQWINVKGIADIGPIIDLLSCSEALWSKMSSSARETLLEDCSSILLVGCNNDNKKRNKFSQLVEKAPGLTYVIASILDGARAMNLPKNKMEEVRHNILLVSMQQNNARESGLGLFRLARRCISISKQLPPKQFQHLTKTIKLYSAPTSSVRNKFGAAIVLSTFGTVLFSNSSQAAASVASSSFASLLSSNDASIVIRTMSSMEVFATKVPPAHRQLLPHCIPKSCQLFLQCRLKGEIYCFATKGILQHISPTQLFEWRSEEGKALSISFHLDRSFYSSIAKKFHRGSSSVDIVRGSRIISLQDPKRSNVKAVLILPPEVQGVELSDIIGWRQSQIDGELIDVSDV